MSHLADPRNANHASAAEVYTEDQEKQDTDTETEEEEEEEKVEEEEVEEEVKIIDEVRGKGEEAEEVIVKKKGASRTVALWGAADLSIKEENKSELESLRRENVKLRVDEEKRRVDKSKLEKKRDDKVLSEHLAAIKAKLKSKACASKPANQFGPLDISTKVVGTRPKTLQKGDSKSDSPAKRNRTEKSHPVTADPKHNRTGPPLTGAGLKAPPKMLHKQGPHS